MSKFTWVNPKEEDNRGNRIAAIDPQTYMIAHIYDNVVCAAKAFEYIADKEFLVKQIGKAVNTYHMEVCGFYWKKID